MFSRESSRIAICSPFSVRASDKDFVCVSSQNKFKMESKAHDTRDSFISPSEKSKKSMSELPLENFRSIAVDHVSESSESDYSESSFTKFSTPQAKEYTRKLNFNIDTSLIPRISEPLLTSVAESDKSDVSILENSFNYSDEVSGKPDVTRSLKKTMVKTWLNNIPLTPAKPSTNESLNVNKQCNANLHLNLQCALQNNIETVKVETTSQDSPCSKSLNFISNISNIDSNPQEISKDRPYNLRKPSKAGKENKVFNSLEFSKLVPKILVTPIAVNKTQLTDKLSTINPVDKKSSNRKTHKSKNRTAKIMSSLDIEQDISKIMDSVMTLKMSSDEEEKVKQESSRKVLQPDYYVYPEEHYSEEGALNLPDKNLFTPRRKLYFRNTSDDFLEDGNIKKEESSVSFDNNSTYFTPCTKPRLRGLGALLSESSKTKKEVKTFNSLAIGSGKIIFDTINSSESPARDEKKNAFSQYQLDDNRLSGNNSQHELQITKYTTLDTFNDKSSEMDSQGNCSFDVSYLLNECESKNNINGNNNLFYKNCMLFVGDASLNEQLIDNNTNSDINEGVENSVANSKMHILNVSRTSFISCKDNLSKSNCSLSMSSSNSSSTQANGGYNSLLTNNLLNCKDFLVQENIDNGSLYQGNNISVQSLSKNNQNKLMCFDEVFQNKNKDFLPNLGYSNEPEDKDNATLSDNTNESGSKCFLNSNINGSTVEENICNGSSLMFTDTLTASSSNQVTHKLQISLNESHFNSKDTTPIKNLMFLKSLDSTAGENGSPISLTKDGYNKEELSNIAINTVQSPTVLPISRKYSEIHFDISKTSSEEFENKTREEKPDAKTEINEVAFNFGSFAHEEKTFCDTECEIVQNNISNNEIIQKTSQVSYAHSDSDDSYNGILRSKNPLKKNYLNVSGEDVVKHSTLDKNIFDDWEKPLCPPKKTNCDKYDPNLLILRNHELSSSSDVEITEYGSDDVVEVSSESSEAEEPSNNYSSELALSIYRNTSNRNSAFDESFVQSKKRQLPNIQIPSHSSSPFHTSFILSLTEEVPPEMCHPTAVKYRDSFQKNKDVLVDILFKLYNQEVFDSKLPPLEIKWSGRLTTTSGITKSSSRITSKGKVRTSGIKLSKTIVDTAAKLRDVLLHEMCHAANWLIDERSAGHGPLFRKWADKARFRFPEIPKVSVCHRYELHWKYIYKCTFCGYEVGKMKLSLKDYACGLCGGHVAVV